MDERTVFAAVVVVGLALLLGVPAALRRRRQRRDETALAESVARGLDVPASLHPVIDTDRCIGSLACLKACPEGDILGIVDGAARLVHGANCIGHGRCAAACPMDAITLVFGSATRGVDLPEVDDRFESSRPGVHLVGELAGMGLIQNAIRQGAECAGYLAEALAGPGAPGGDGAEVVVVGAGPAGVSCALELRSRGVPVRLLERERLGRAMAGYPRQGLVMTGPLRLPGARPLRAQRVPKQALLEWFVEAITATGQQVEEGVTVTGLSGEDGALVVETDAGPITASKVVLATGRGGTPRRLGVPGESLPKVTHALVDAAQYAGARVLVVGGGDAAVEAACALAEGPAAEVTLAHRGAALTRCRPENRARAAQLAGRGRLTLRLGTSVTRIEPDQVVLQAGGGASPLANDWVIACLGGEPPRALLDRLGVALRRPRAAGEPAGHRHAPAARHPTPEQEARHRWRFRMGLVAAGVALLLAWLWWLGRSYYLLPQGSLHDSPLHRAFRPAGRLGLTIGVAATAVMLTNFVYVLRKRWGAMAGLGSLASWLDLHVFVGVLSPLVIAFHAAFQSNNLLATTTYLALAVVVATGLVGRYLYGLLPGAGGASVELADLLGQLERQRTELAGAPRGGTLGALLGEAGAAPSTAPLPWQLLRAIPDALAFRSRLAVELRRLGPGAPPGLRAGLLRLHALRTQAGLFTGLRRLMRIWRGLHVALAVLLVAALLAHIGVAVYLGYRPRLG